MHDIQYTDALTSLIKVNQRLAQFDVKMQLSTLLTLLFVAKHQDREEGVTTADIQKWVGLSSAAASRNTYYWAEGTKDMPNAGYKLMDVFVDPLDRRKRLLKLTPKGQVFVNQICEALQN